MNRNEEIMTILQEECAEVIQAVSKVKRFGAGVKSDLRARTPHPTLRGFFVSITCLNHGHRQHRTRL